MNVAQLQLLIGAAPDGQWGPASKAALLAHFSNPDANTISRADIASAAARLGCSILQLQAVRHVESNSGGFDAGGKPKILFERHKFHRFTGGRFSPSVFSLTAPGGYSANSWDKLFAAIGTGEVDAAFMACSWGAFQIMGQWWSDLGYPSPYAMAWTCVQSEGDHLEMLVRFIERNHLADELRAITSNPETCRAFAAGYNGPGYKANAYHTKLAAFMGRG